MFLADEWRLSPSLTLNLGVRYEFFGLPEEVNGRIGNVDFEALTNTENPVNAFIVPKNVQNTGFAAVDGAIAASIKASNNHTLKGQDWNNVAPRLGFAWTPSQRGSCAAATACSSIGRRPRSSTPCSATIRSCASRKSRSRRAPCR